MNYIYKIFIVEKLIKRINFSFWALFFFSAALMFGGAFALLDSYDLKQNPDIRTYLALAQGNFDESPVRRYRVLVPFLAATVNWLFKPILSPLKPWDFPSDQFSLCMSFFVVNLAIMATFGVLVFKFCKSLGTSSLAALLGLIAILSSRWVPYFVGLPMVDSLYLLVTIAVLVAITTKNISLAVFSIFIGPWAKESFIFLAPLLFFYGPIPKLKQIVLFFLSGLLVFSFRLYIDYLYQLPHLQSFESIFSTITSVQVSLIRFFSFHGLYELFSIAGFWILVLLPLLFTSHRKCLITSTPSWAIYFIWIVFIHAFLSTELARMFYLFSPLLAFWIALTIDKLFTTLILNKI